MFIVLGFTCVSFIVCFILITILKAVLHKTEVDNVSHRSVFITGCDTGFGNLLAKTLDAKGVQVFAGCLTDEGARALEEVTSSRLKTVKIDVTDKYSIQQAYLFVKEHVGDEGLWGLVNNAGVMPTFCPAEWAGIEGFENVCKVNLLGTIAVTLAFLPLLRKQCGRLVSVCSVTSNCAYPGITNYVVSKAAVKMFTTCMRRELLNTGITAHTIEPGGFQTNITDKDRIINSYKRSYKTANPELQQFYGGTISRYILRGMRLINKYVDTKPQIVADAMAHALLSRYPQRQYLVGKDANTFFRIIRFMPEWIVDHILGWPRPYGEKATELDY